MIFAIRVCQPHLFVKLEVECSKAGIGLEGLGCAAETPCNSMQGFLPKPSSKIFKCSAHALR